jgi:hypothetical protein
MNFISFYIFAEEVQEIRAANEKPRLAPGSWPF